METERVGRRWLLAATLAVLIAGAPAAAHAHGRVIVGGVIGFPGYYPYPYSVPPPYEVYPYPSWDYYDPAPPPGFVPGHWEFEYDRSGRRVRVWVPGHLR